MIKQKRHKLDTKQIKEMKLFLWTNFATKERTRKNIISASQVRPAGNYKETLSQHHRTEQMEGRERRREHYGEKYRHTQQRYANEWPPPTA